MPYIAPEVVTEAKRMDLLTYLRTYEPGQLVRVSGNTYCTREHDSLKQNIEKCLLLLHWDLQQLWELRLLLELLQQEPQFHH